MWSKKTCFPALKLLCFKLNKALFGKELKQAQINIYLFEGCIFYIEYMFPDLKKKVFLFICLLVVNI